MASGRIASRYSKSLFELASDQGTVDTVKNDMDTVLDTCNGSRELQSLLKNPVVSNSNKKAVLNKIFDSCSETTKSFMQLLIDKKREAELPLIAGQYIDAYDKMKGIAKATVISAMPLNDETLNKVKSYVKGITSTDEIILTNEIDPSIIGGIIVKHEDRLLDMSVSRELREIRKELIYN